MNLKPVFNSVVKRNFLLEGSPIDHLTAPEFFPILNLFQLIVSSKASLFDFELISFFVVIKNSMNLLNGSSLRVIVYHSYLNLKYWFLNYSGPVCFLVLWQYAGIIHLRRFCVKTTVSNMAKNCLSNCLILLIRNWFLWFEPRIFIEEFDIDT